MVGRGHGVSRRIQDQHDLDDGTKGSQFGEGDLAQGGILWGVALVRDIPAFPLSSTVSLSPASPPFDHEAHSSLSPMAIYLLQVC